MRFGLAVLAATFVATVSVPASAQTYTSIRKNIPRNAYITIGNLDWAWMGGPPKSDFYGDYNLDYQSRLGWRLPTAEEFAQRPDWQDFQVPDGNAIVVQDPGWGFADHIITWSGLYGRPTGRFACASYYFSVLRGFCSWDNAQLGLWYDPSQPSTERTFGLETLFVRSTDFVPTHPIPEPATWVMMIGGFGLTGAAMRRRAARVTYA